MDPVVRPRPGGRLAVYSLGLVRNAPLKTALASHGAKLVFGPTARKADAVAVWGSGPVANRGIRAAARRVLPCLYLEDALFRSVGTGQDEPVIGLMADWQAPYYEARSPNDLTTLLKRQPVVLSADRQRAENLIAEIRRSGLSKYNPALRTDPHEPGYVLIIDQVRGDASIEAGCASAGDFATMLAAARVEHPGKRILIRRHPRANYGHFTPSDVTDGVAFERAGVSAADSLGGAAAVYAVTSSMGFEALIHGHRPRIFGMPFYAGWGLTSDEMTNPERTVRHDLESLVHRVLVDYALWFDPYDGRRCGPERAIRGLAARTRGARRKATDRILVGFARWKRPHMKQYLGNVTYSSRGAGALVDTARSRQARIAAWASREPEGLTTAVEGFNIGYDRIEDGFLRSRGLGANLHPPLSLVIDDLGIHYDPARESRLERLLSEAPLLDTAALTRAAMLRTQIVDLGLSKYNEAAKPDIPKKRPGKFRILVPGQVENDAAVLKGAGEIATNGALIRAVRERFAAAEILYKPHPDVVAGLRAGEPSASDLTLVDGIIKGGDAATVLASVDAVATMTSLLGFEALLRGLPVVTFGVPFYAGWGVSEDLGDIPGRRLARLTVDHIVHAALIDYPVYIDPVTGLEAPPEVILSRLAGGAPSARGVWRSGLARAQGALRR